MKKLFGVIKKVLPSVLLILSCFLFFKAISSLGKRIELLSKLFTEDAQTINKLQSSLITNEQSRDDAVNTVRKDVVALTNPEGTSGGTGFYVKAKSGKVYIMTNMHVCQLAQNGEILVDRQFYAPVLSIYKYHDLCLLGNPLNHSGLSVASSDYDTENVYIIGHPLLNPLSTTKGELSGDMEIQLIYDVKDCSGPGYEYHAVTDPFLQLIYRQGVCTRTLEANPVTANILPGNSGSPVVNIYRHVVGVAFAGINGSGRGYIVPLKYVQDFLSGF